ncbi:MAG TPA: GntR family transcriptional regulator [Candidatus Blautia faecigallinarum]|uniref:GntR family transcriptional regulator n=1 Tax=Candidatus Blautia faecigallinarum TaxID=2838488 RepID=A0A9D2ISH1_9FIRM|nr:GntR family transcriptional regulator [Candidatus Blautia faecigallinarum]
MAEIGVPKYYALMEQIKKDILAGEIRPGEKIPSENVLSKKYSISRHTVRKALGILEQEGYVEAFHGKGTFCSKKMLHTRKTGNIAVVTTYISDYIFPHLIQGMDKVLSREGYTIILKNTGNSRQKEAKCLEELLNKEIDGLIIEPSKSQLACRHRNLYQNLEQYGIPYIFIQGMYGEMPDKPHILMDDVQGGYLAASYLTGLGHRKIWGFFKADDIQGMERHKGYVQALREAGIFYDPDNVVWFHTEDRKVKPAMMAKRMVEEQGIPDAVVCYNDQIAVQIMDVLESMGYNIPQDVSVTGYDNSLYAQRGCGLTTIAHPQEKLGEMAAELILEKLDHIPEAESKVERVIRPELIIRGSCRKK